MSTSSLPLTPGAWRLDHAHSTIEFTVRHMAISKVRGRFTTVDATIEVGSDLAGTSVHAEIDLASVDTGNADRDVHLRSSDFFDAVARPTMVFSSTEVVDRGDGRYLLVGSLTLNGHTRPQELVVEFHGTEAYPMDGSVHAGFSATGSLSRREFGIDFNVPLAAGGFVISDRVDIEFELQIHPVGVPSPT